MSAFVADEIEGGLAGLVVASFVIPEKADDTWGGAGRLLLSALIGYVLASPLLAEAQHMRSVARLTTTGRDISTVLRALVKTEREHLPTWIVDGFNQYIALEPETRNSAVFNVNMAMSLWNNGLISAATASSDFDIRELRRRPMTIFIDCTIAELAIFRPLIRILFQQIQDLMMVRTHAPTNRTRCCSCSTSSTTSGAWTRSSRRSPSAPWKPSPSRR